MAHNQTNQSAYSEHPQVVDNKTSSKDAKKMERLKSGGLLAYGVEDVCHLLGIGRTTFYALVKDGSFRTVMIRGRRVVPAGELQRLLNADADQLSLNNPK